MKKSHLLSLVGLLLVTGFTTQAQNVGINTTTPNGELTISPTAVKNRKIVLWDGGINNDHQYYGLGVNGNTFRYQVDQTASNHIWYAGTSTTTSQELMRLTGTGFLGIGTAAPAQKLHIDGEDNPRIVLRSTSNAIVGRGGIIAFRESSGTNNGVQGWGINIRHNTGQDDAVEAEGLHFEQVDNNGVDIRHIMTIDQIYRRVGIGTKIPAQQLDVTGAIRLGNTGVANLAGSIRFNAGAFQVNTDGSGTWHNLATAANLGWGLTGNAGTAAGTNFIGTTDAVDLVFRTQNTEKMRLSTAGRLGIGTNNPLSGLHMVNNAGSDFNDDFILETSSNGGEIPGMFIRRSLGTQAAPVNLTNGQKIGVFGFEGRRTGGYTYNVNSGFQSFYKGDGTTALADFRIITNNADRMTIDENGNVGIGTTTPAALFHVNGAAQATAWNVVSDRRFKDNIQTQKNALANVMRLRGVTYTWNKEEVKGKKDIGFVAQEVEEIFPEVVQTNTEGYKTVEYSRLTSVLVEAVKELKGEIDALKAENAGLKSQNSDLKSKSASLESRLEKIEEALKLNAKAKND